MERINVIVGHFGSGKTEFSVNHVINLLRDHGEATICDLDIANPYFRSREKQKFLEDIGVTVISNFFEKDITEDLPAVSPAVKGPLQNIDRQVVLDVGGNSSGAMLLNQYKEYLLGDDSRMLCVINANRPETDTLKGCLNHIVSIHNETGIPFKGIINNTNMLRETTAKDIIKGHKLCQKVAKETKIPLLWDVIEESLLGEAEKLAKKEKVTLSPYPIKLYMRPIWLDR